MELEKETALVETILFLESEPVNEKAIAKIAQLSEEVVRQCLEHLKVRCQGADSGIELDMIAGGWTLVPKKEFWSVLR
ncbi:MAG: SMC-Scp complex subunit ScpB, partial [Treponemataceae bacterium]|nr:SMC-Scp complex subunit ScpB [Treponemataceae bacterium]